MAVGITAAVCFALTLFAFQTKWDFTVMGGVLFVAVIILMVFGIVSIFVKGKIITLVYASLGALIFSVYLIYDTQLMVSNLFAKSLLYKLELQLLYSSIDLFLDGRQTQIQHQS